MSIKLEVWGDYALFTRPEMKVERVSYDVMTPSAARGLIEAIYWHPGMRWRIDRIHVCAPIRFTNLRRNEVKSKVSDKPIFTDEDRTQRQTVALRDVHYRFAASICPRKEFTGTTEQLYAQALRRIRGGKTFMQPSLGLREFVAYFQEGDCERGPKPIPVDMDLGLMVYDIFDLHDCEVREKTRPRLSLYHCVMRQGVIQVPPYDSPEVLKGDAVC